MVVKSNIMDRREALKRSAIITGFTLSSSAVLGILKGCTPTGKPSWPTRFLTDEEVPLVSSIADFILPKTDTPGALDVHVPEFIDLMMKDNYSEKEQATFHEGAAAFIIRVDDTYSSSFDKCTAEEKASIIQEVEQESFGKLHESGEKSFYLMVKELTILGFYTSDTVMQNMLDYHPIPTRYDGCIPFLPDGKLYVDNNV